MMREQWPDPARPPFKFVITDFLPGMLQFWSEHECLKPLLRNGLIDLGVFGAFRLSAALSRGATQEVITITVHSRYSVHLFFFFRRGARPRDQAIAQRGKNHLGRQVSDYCCCELYVRHIKTGARGVWASVLVCVTRVITGHMSTPARGINMSVCACAGCVPYSGRAAAGGDGSLAVRVRGRRAALSTSARGWKAGCRPSVIRWRARWRCTCNCVDFFNVPLERCTVANLLLVSILTNLHRVHVIADNSPHALRLGLSAVHAGDLQKRAPTGRRELLRARSYDHVLQLCLQLVSATANISLFSFPSFLGDAAGVHV